MMDDYLKYNHKKIKDKKYILKRIKQRQNNLSLKHNILQFSLNAINNILINNINDSVSLGMLNISNYNILKNEKQIINNSVYINSINDCIDYKLKGNIYKTSQKDFFNLYPNIENIFTNKIVKSKK